MTERRTFPVVGMMCAACSANVERRLSHTPGVQQVSVSLATRTAIIDYDADVTTPEALKSEVAAIGYDLVIENDRDVTDIERQAYIKLRRNMWISWLLAIAVMALGMIYMPSDHNAMLRCNLILAALSLANMAICGKEIYSSAWRQARHRSANMDTLVALSTIVAWCFSLFNTVWGNQIYTQRGLPNNVWFDASTMILTFVLTGRFLEERAKGSTASSLRALMALAPRTARLVTDEGVQQVPLSTIVPRDRLQLLQGDSVPVDGTLHDGEVWIDESILTGEPQPILKKKGDNLYAGTLIIKGEGVMRAQKVGDATVLAAIIERVRQAQSSKAPVQRMVDKVALVFVPMVIAISIITLAVWLIVGGWDNLTHALLSAVTVLVVACPCALGLATPTALMVAIGRAAQCNLLVRDATSLEQLHHIDALIVDKTGTLTTPNSQALSATDNLPLEAREQLKTHSAEAVQCLKERGVEIHIASGDREEAVAYWSDKLGIKHHLSAVSPTDKENLVRRLQSQGKIVAMVGDGVNDAQALATADVAIAMAQGTDVAIETAQLTLMGDDLRRIATAIDLSKATIRIIRQNLFWAFLYNVICIPLAAGALYPTLQFTPTLAAALMAMSSVIVVLNSLRLGKIKL